MSVTAVPVRISPPRLLHHLGHLPRDEPVVDDAGGRDEEGAQARDVRLAPLQLGGVEALDRDLVLPAALLERLHALQLDLARGDEELAAALERHAMLPGEADRGLRPFLREAGLETARGVVDARHE